MLNQSSRALPGCCIKCTWEKENKNRTSFITDPPIDSHPLHKGADLERANYALFREKPPFLTFFSRQSLCSRSSLNAPKPKTASFVSPFSNRIGWIRTSERSFCNICNIQKHSQIHRFATFQTLSCWDGVVIRIECVTSV